MELERSRRPDREIYSINTTKKRREDRMLDFGKRKKLSKLSKLSKQIKSINSLIKRIQKM
jgi:hypothetical protein